MPEIDVIQRIKQLCKAYSWTVYRLAKESGITYSTLNTMLNKGTLPSIPTLEKICQGFGITLAQFFSEDEDTAVLTIAQKKHLAAWDALNDENQFCVSKYMEFLIHQQDSQT